MLEYGRESPYRADGERANDLLLEGLRELLNQNGLTMKEFAERFGITGDRLWRPGRPLYFHRVAEYSTALGYVLEWRFVPAEVYGPLPQRADCPVCGEPKVRVTTKGKLASHGYNRGCRGVGIKVWAETMTGESAERE